MPTKIPGFVLFALTTKTLTMSIWLVTWITLTMGITVIVGRKLSEVVMRDATRKEILELVLDTFGLLVALALTLSLFWF